MSALHITDAEVFGITKDVCEGFLGLDVCVADADSSEPGGLDVSSFVHISGDWTGAVAVRLNSSLALKLAASMFGTEADELSESEVMDAVGEVTNMIGGSIKNRVQGSCALSTPGLLLGSDATFRVPGAQVRLVTAAQCGGRLVLVDVWERRSASIR